MHTACDLQILGETVIIGVQRRDAFQDCVMLMEEELLTKETRFRRTCMVKAVL